MPAAPSSESVAKGRGKDLDKSIGKWPSNDSSEVPLKKPQGDSLASRVSFADISGLILSTQCSGRLLSSPLTSQSLLTQLGMHPLAGHSSSDTSTPPQTPGDVKAQDKMHNEVTWLHAAHQDWIQVVFWFWDEEIAARMELNLFLWTLVSPSLWTHVGHEESMGPWGSTRIVNGSPLDSAWEVGALPLEHYITVCGRPPPGSIKERTGGLCCPKEGAGGHWGFIPWVHQWLPK